MLKQTLAVLAGALALSATAADLTITGVGASFPAPVYRVWTYGFSNVNKDIRVNYQPLGSGAGIYQIMAETANFGGTDKPLKIDELNKSGLLQFPMLSGGVVLVYNLPGIKTNQLKLDQAVLADIFLGKIKNWSDPRIAALNPGLRLPKLKITVVHRTDSSGTTYIFTDYLAKISKEWAEKVGAGSDVKWPAGIGGSKNPGVCNMVRKSRGAIGYTEYTFATEYRLPVASLKNRDGKFVTADSGAFSAAAAHADWKADQGFYQMLTDQPGADSWPIVGVTYILIHRDQKNAAVAGAMLKYFNWCFTSGRASAAKMHYVPMPGNVVKMIGDYWKNEITVNGQKNAL